MGPYTSIIVSQSQVPGQGVPRPAGVSEGFTGVAPVGPKGFVRSCLAPETSVPPPTSRRHRGPRRRGTRGESRGRHPSLLSHRNRRGRAGPTVRGTGERRGVTFFFPLYFLAFFMYITLDIQNTRSVVKRHLRGRNPKTVLDLRLHQRRGQWAGRGHPTGVHRDREVGVLGQGRTRRRLCARGPKHGHQGKTRKCFIKRLALRRP